MRLSFSSAVARALAGALVLSQVCVASETYTMSLPDARVHLGTFGRVHVLDANGDSRRDVAFLCGDLPVLAYSPAHAQTTLPVDGCAASELAVWPRLGGDELLALTASGLERLTYDAVAAAGRPGYVRTPVLGAAFAGCSSLVVFDLDGDRRLDLAALAPGGGAVVRALGLPGGGFALAPDLPLAASADRLAAAPWLGGPALVLVRGAAVEVLDTAGLLLDAFVAPYPLVDLAVVQEANGGALALLGASPSGASAVFVVRPGALTEPAVDLGPLHAIACVAADLDGSGDDDLVVTGAADGALRLLHHGGPSGAAYAAKRVTTVPVLDEVFDPSTQRANAVAADFDNDGDVDLVHLVEATRDAVVVRADDIDHTIFAPELVMATLDYAGPAPHALVDLAAPPLPSGVAPTHVEVELWGELPSGASHFPFGPSTFLLGYDLVPVDPLAATAVARVDSPVAFGARAWVCMRGVVVQSDVIVDRGTDRVLAFFDDPGDGGGTGGAEPMPRGDGQQPPPEIKFP